MPVILSKPHGKMLRSEEDLNDYKVINESFLTSDFLLSPVRYKTYLKNDHGFVITTVDDNPVCNLYFKFIFGQENLVQVQSIFVDKAYRGERLAQNAYKHLLCKYNILSDTEQTIDGANQWRIKLASDDDIVIHIIDNFPDSPELRCDENGEVIEYLFVDGVNPLNPSVWSSDLLDPRNEDPEFGYSVSESRESVVLRASLKIDCQKPSPQ